MIDSRIMFLNLVFIILPSIILTYVLPCFAAPVLPSTGLT